MMSNIYTKGETSYIYSGNISIFPLSNLRRVPSNTNDENHKYTSLPDGRIFSEYNVTSIINSVVDCSDGFIASYRTNNDKLTDINIVINGYVIQIVNTEGFSPEDTPDLYANILLVKGASPIGNNIDYLSNWLYNNDRAELTNSSIYSPVYDGVAFSEDVPTSDNLSTIFNLIGDGIELSNCVVKTVRIFESGRICESSLNKFKSRSIENIYGGVC